MIGFPAPLRRSTRSYARVEGRDYGHRNNKGSASVRDPSVSEREVLVDGTHRGRPFADGCRDSLGRARPDVAYGEQPRIARLKGQRSPTQCFPSPVEVFFAQGPVGEHETAGIEGRAPRQPIRGRICADEGEQSDTR